MILNPIPYGRQWLDENDIEAVANVLRSDWITQGPKIEEFEHAISEYIGAQYAVVFNSGTSALHGAMHAAGLRQGDEVITSPITFVATPNSAIYMGAKPVFVDIDLGTYCIDIDKIEKKITQNTKVITPVDMAGFPLELNRIREIANEQDAIVIEDAAHALGAVRNGKKVGLEADMTMFSFHPVKHITTGEGGAVVTDNEEFYEKMKLFRNHGITKDPALMERNDGPWYYEMLSLGYNNRITDIQCALGIMQLKKIDFFIKRRNEIASWYNEEFASDFNITVPPIVNNNSSLHAYHIYPILINKADKLKTVNELRKRGILTQVHYIPVHLQPYYREQYNYHEGDFPYAEEYYQKTLTIPLFPKMSDEDVQYVIDAVKKCIKQG